MLIGLLAAAALGSGLLLVVLPRAGCLAQGLRWLVLVVGAVLAPVALVVLKREAVVWQGWRSLLVYLVLLLMGTLGVSAAILAATGWQGLLVLLGLVGERTELEEEFVPASFDLAKLFDFDRADLALDSCLFGIGVLLVGGLFLLGLILAGGVKGVALPSPTSGLRRAVRAVLSFGYAGVVVLLSGGMAWLVTR